MSYYELLMKFTDGSVSFAAGFECGIVWEQMASSVPGIDRNINKENKEQFILMAEVWDYSISIIDEGFEGWLRMYANKNKPSGKSPTLRVIRGGVIV